MDESLKISLSQLRVISMFLVVIYHCMCFYTPLWPFTSEFIGVYQVACTFLKYIHLPAFVIIASYLFAYYYRRLNYPSFLGFIRKKATRLLIPYIVWGAIMLLLQPDFYSLKLFCTGFHHLWFLLMLFELFVIFYISGCIWSKTSALEDLIIFIVLLALNDLLPRIITITPYCCVTAAIMYAPAFFIGIIAEKHDLFNRLKGTQRRFFISSLPIALFALVVLAVLFYKQRFLLSHSSVSILVSRIIGYVLVLQMVFFFTNVKFKSFVRKNLDENSMGIYIVHHIIIFWVLQYPIAQKLFEGHQYLAPLVCFFTVMPLSYLISSTINRTKLKWILG